MHEHNSNRAHSAHLHKITPITENPLLIELEERLNQFSAGLLPTLPEPKPAKKSGGAV